MRVPLHWTDVFMAMAYGIAQRSKDPSTQVGAVISDQRHRLISSGFNGPPARMPDGFIPWTRPEKYPFIIHAEDNAMWFGAQARGMDGLSECTMFVTAKPCSRCALLAVRAQIRQVVYGVIEPIMCDNEDWLLTQRIASIGGLELQQWRTA